MEADRNEREVGGTEPGAMEGTKEMGYWEFKKEVCDKSGWQMRRTDGQIYLVIDGKHERLGIFKSGEGYFPDPVATADAETPKGNA